MQKSANIDRERTTLAQLAHPVAVKCAHVGEDFRVGWIQTATEISKEYIYSAQQTCRHYRVEGAC